MGGYIANRGLFKELPSHLKSGRLILDAKISNIFTHRVIGQFSCDEELLQISPRTRMPIFKKFQTSNRKGFLVKGILHPKN